MQVLLVFATYLEAREVLDCLENTFLPNPVSNPMLIKQDGRDKGRFFSFRNEKHEIEVLITGVGIAATTYWLTRLLSKKHYSLVANVGIAGSFLPDRKTGQTFLIFQDRFGDLGATFEDGFRDLFDMGLSQPDEPPFTGGWLSPDYERVPTIFRILPKAVGLTVALGAGNMETIEERKQKYNPELESMEGAAVFYVCMSENIPCFQVRTVSNIIAPREEMKWEVDVALSALSVTVMEWLHDLSL